MVIGTLRLTPLPSRRREVLEILRFIEGPVRAQPGCNAYEIYEGQTPERAVLLVERWDSEETLATHLRSEAYGRILGAIELSGAQPDIRFEHVSSSEGMEFIERARNRGGPPAGR